MRTAQRPVKIVCAPDSFKETLTAAEAADAMAAGVADIDPDIEVDRCPVADGGEGTMDTLLSALGGDQRTIMVTGPLGGPIEATFGITADGGTGIVELARASGLALIPRDRRDPTTTTTYGTGELIRAARQAGCTDIIVCIGGSGTCDGAAGLAQAIGVRFLDRNDALVETPLTGGTLMDIASIEKPDDLPRLRVACDVTNPLLGPNGSAAVYGPQKGANLKQVQQLDDALRHLASLTDVDPQFPGAGAAGGAGFGLVGLCDAKLERGIELVLDAVGFDQRCRGADVVLTGEGQLDAQSLSGKVTVGVAEAARRLNVPTIAIVGATGRGYARCLIDNGGALERCVSLSQRVGAQRAMSDAFNALREVTRDVVRASVT